jgi:hypothetical protein
MRSTTISPKRFAKIFRYLNQTPNDPSGADSRGVHRCGGCRALALSQDLQGQAGQLSRELHRGHRDAAPPLRAVGKPIAERDKRARFRRPGSLVARAVEQQTLSRRRRDGVYHKRRTRRGARGVTERASQRRRSGTSRTSLRSGQGGCVTFSDGPTHWPSSLRRHGGGVAGGTQQASRRISRRGDELLGFVSRHAERSQANYWPVWAAICLEMTPAHRNRATSLARTRPCCTRRPASDPLHDASRRSSNAIPHFGFLSARRRFIRRGFLTRLPEINSNFYRCSRKGAKKSANETWRAKDSRESAVIPMSRSPRSTLPT